MPCRIVLLTLGYILSSACNGGGGNTTGDGTDTTGDGGTDGVSTGTVADPSTDSPTTAPTSDPGDTGEATVDGETTAPNPDTTTDPSSTTGEAPGTCVLVCEKFVECDVMTDGGTCVAECSENLAELEPDCLTATEAFFTCAAGLTCEEIDELDGGAPEACLDQMVAQQQVCESNECVSSVSTSEDNSECGVTIECPNKPPKAMNCDAETCTCLDDGEMVGQCDAGAICLNLVDLEEKVADCCGF